MASTVALDCARRPRPQRKRRLQAAEAIAAPEIEPDPLAARGKHLARIPVHALWW